MPDVQWTMLSDFADIGADTDIFEPWLIAVHLVRHISHLRIRASGLWSPMPGTLTECGANGHTALVLPAAQLIIPNCPVGALIGRFSGGTASYWPAGADGDSNKPFPIGEYCIVTPPDKWIGPVFIGFNILFRPIRVRQLSLTVEGASPPM